MARNQLPEQWLDKNSHDQIQFALDFMYKNGLTALMDEHGTPYEQVLKQLNILTNRNNPDTKALLKKMKEKWRTKKCESQPGYIRISTKISDETYRRLLILAKSNEYGKNEYGKTVENLINRGFDFEKEEKTKRAEELEKMKAQLKKRWPKKQFIPLIQQIGIKNHIEKLNLIIDKQQGYIEKLLFENCKLQTILDANNLTNAEIDMQSDSLIYDLYTNRIKFYNKERSTMLTSTPDTYLQDIYSEEYSPLQAEAFYFHSMVDLNTISKQNPSNKAKTKPTVSNNSVNDTNTENTQLQTVETASESTQQTNDERPIEKLASSSPETPKITNSTPEPSNASTGKNPDTNIAVEPTNNFKSSGLRGFQLDMKNQNKNSND